jgi:hypothetical protein
LEKHDFEKVEHSKEVNLDCFTTGQRYAWGRGGVLETEITSLPTKPLVITCRDYIETDDAGRVQVNSA